MTAQIPKKDIIRSSDAMGDSEVLVKGSLSAGSVGGFPCGTLSKPTKP